MKAQLYAHTPAALLDGSIEPAHDALAVMLLSPAYAFNARHLTRAEVAAAEVKGLGYVAGGKPLAGVYVDESAGAGLLRAAPSLWDPSTIRARFAALYKIDGGQLLGCIDFEADKISENGAFRLSWPGGVLLLQEG